MSEDLEDLEHIEVPLGIDKHNWEYGDQLFLTRILPEQSVEDIRATDTTSQRLVEGACWSTTQTSLTLWPNYVQGFELVFAKEDFNTLPEHRRWDHAIEIIPGSEPKFLKVYPLLPIEQIELNTFLAENLWTGCICLSKSPMAAPVFFDQKEGWNAPTHPGLPYTKCCDNQEQILPPSDI